MDRKFFLGIVLAAALFCIESGLQVSGLTNLPLAILLWSLAAVLAVWAGIDALDATGKRAVKLGRIWSLLRYLQNNDFLVLGVGVLASALAAFGMWAWQSRPVPEHPPQGSLYVTCSLSSEQVKSPDNGVLYMLQVQDYDPGGSDQSLVESGAASDTIQNLHVFEVKRCQFINYFDKPIFGLEIIGHYYYRKNTGDRGSGRSPNESHNAISGPIINEQDAKTFIKRVDPGLDKAFVFYVLNMTDKFVNITWKNTATGRLGIDGESISVKVSGADGQMNLNPYLRNPN